RVTSCRRNHPTHSVFAASCRRERTRLVDLERKCHPETSVSPARLWWGRRVCAVESAIPATPPIRRARPTRPSRLACRCSPRRRFSGHWIRRAKWFPGSWPHYTRAGPCGEESFLAGVFGTPPHSGAAAWGFRIARRRRLASKTAMAANLGLYHLLEAATTKDCSASTGTQTLSRHRSSGKTLQRILRTRLRSCMLTKIPRG
ncbi:MAG: hypothetical protein JWP03_3490, partial [Phycisphaerales bacterium]|nr:hypothetical protein [Phycisphaerales bacterium]